MTYVVLGLIGAAFLSVASLRKNVEDGFADAIVGLLFLVSCVVIVGLEHL
jgi:hypothetical protein